MAVWTFGSARRKTAFRIWYTRLMGRLLRLRSKEMEPVPDELLQDLAISGGDRHSDPPREDFWKRLVERRLPPL
ncbi:hypothetical protein [Rhizobium sp. Root149]|jgi:hypothetical protein|uniref:hypothetical protein n=1 Tax=Rhizobium sp. Root149 TaxID=1736473 RepID=UPI000A6A0C98|nr:hypothetical protein [Rhizobium sp. Root149]